MRIRNIIFLVIINLLLFIGSIVCLCLTWQTNKIINETDMNFTYEENGNDIVFLTTPSGNTVKAVFGNEAVKVVESYKINDKEEMLYIVLFIRSYLKENGYTPHRKLTEFVGEYRLHNVLYALNYKRKNIADADLDYESDERWYVNAVSKIIGFIGI